MAQQQPQQQQQPVVDSQPIVVPPVKEEPLALQPPPMHDQFIPAPPQPEVEQHVPYSSPSNSIPDYIPVEEIFRSAEEAERKRRLQMEEEQQQQLQDGANGLLAQVLAILEDNLPFLHGLEDPVPGARYIIIAVVTSLSFLTLYYKLNNMATERLLKARISQLDAQLYESQTAKEECGSIQVANKRLSVAALKFISLFVTMQGRLTEFEAETAELRSQKEALEAERTTLSQRLTELEQEKDVLEKELESATNSAIEANRLFEELMASQTGDEEWQQSVEALKVQLNKQQMAIEQLNVSLAVKTAECETMTAEVDELRNESERYKVCLLCLYAVGRRHCCCVCHVYTNTFLT